MPFVPRSMSRDAPHRALRHAHEHHVAQLLEQRGRESEDAVGREQRDRHGDDGGGRVETVHQLLHDERHRDVRELRHYQEGEREHHAPLVLPQVGRERANVAPLSAFQPVFHGARDSSASAA